MANKKITRTVYFNEEITVEDLPAAYETGHDEAPNPDCNGAFETAGVPAGPTLRHALMDTLGISRKDAVALELAYGKEGHTALAHLLRAVHRRPG